MINSKATFPLYVTDRIAQQKAFYTTHLGFDAVFYDENFYLHLLNPGTGAQIGFMLPELGNQPEFLHAKAAPEGQVISFEVDDIEGALSYAESAGLDITFALKNEDWGQRHFMVRDPAGFILDIVKDERDDSA